MNPLVSIITPCYNMAHCVWRLFDSIIAQDYRPLEFILVDDGSTDDISKLVEQYRPQFEKSEIAFVYFRQENKGLGGAINSGLKLIHGDYFCWPDADDYLESDSISKRVRYLEQHPEFAIVTSNAYIINSDCVDQKKLMVTGDISKHLDEHQFEHLLNEESIFCSGCHFVNTNCFRDVNPNMEIYPARRGQNWQLLLPLYYKYKRGFLNEPLYNYLVFPNSMSRTDDTLDKVIFRLREHRTIIMETLLSIERNQNVDLGKYKRFIKRKYNRLITKIRIKKLLGV